VAGTTFCTAGAVCTSFACGSGIHVADSNNVLCNGSPPVCTESVCCEIDEEAEAETREKQIGGSGGSLEPPGPRLEPPGPLLTHLHTGYMACSECLPTRLIFLAERTCFSQAETIDVEGCTNAAAVNCPSPLGAVKRP
jgi:hypothetical protein